MKYNRNNLFTDDLLYQYMLYSNLKDVKSLCQIDKKASQFYHHSQFWTDKLNYDGLYIYQKNNTFQEYEKIYKAMAKANSLKSDDVEFHFLNEDLSIILPNEYKDVLDEANYVTNKFDRQHVIFYFCHKLFVTKIKGYVYFQLLDQKQDVYEIDMINYHKSIELLMYKMLVDLFYYYPLISYEILTYI